jgi:hypothetical protein
MIKKSTTGLFHETASSQGQLATSPDGAKTAVLLTAGTGGFFERLKRSRESSALIPQIVIMARGGNRVERSGLLTSQRAW